MLVGETLECLASPLHLVLLDAFEVQFGHSDCFVVMCYFGRCLKDRDQFQSFRGLHERFMGKSIETKW